MALRLRINVSAVILVVYDVYRSSVMIDVEQNKEYLRYLRTMDVMTESFRLVVSLLESYNSDTHA